MEVTVPHAKVGSGRRYGKAGTTQGSFRQHLSPQKKLPLSDDVIRTL